MFPVFPNAGLLTCRLTLLPLRSNYAITSSSGGAIFPISMTEKGSLDPTLVSYIP